MAAPYLEAFKIEREQLCTLAQKTLAGVRPEDFNKLKVDSCRSFPPSSSSFDEFSLSHADYKLLPDGRLETTCTSRVERALDTTVFDFLSPGGFAGKSVDCKMVGVTRVSQELKVWTNSSLECADMNRIAVESAQKMLPVKSARRYEQKGRGVCLLPDWTVPLNAGAVWGKSQVKIRESQRCLEVTSSAMSASTKSWMHPGEHYCKLYPISAALDWMMTDSHKPFPYPALSAVEDADLTIQV